MLGEFLFLLNIRIFTDQNVFGVCKRFIQYRMYVHIDIFLKDRGQIIKRVT